jgi:hypothetical protein
MLSLTSNKASLKAETADQATVTAMLVSSTLAPVSGKTVNFESTGEVTITPKSGSTDASGKVTVQATVDPLKAKSASLATVTATLAEDPEVTSTLSLSLVPPTLTPSVNAGETAPTPTVTTVPPDELDEVGPGMHLIALLSLGAAGLIMRRRLARSFN